MVYLEQYKTDLVYMYKEVGETALYKGEEIKIIFDEDYDIDTFKERVIKLKKSDAPFLKKGEIITILGDDYKVMATPQLDDYGVEFSVLVSKND